MRAEYGFVINAGFVRLQSQNISRQIIFFLSLLACVLSEPRWYYFAEYVRGFDGHVLGGCLSSLHIVSKNILHEQVFKK